MFLQNHAKINELNQEEALRWVCGRGRFEIVRLYLRRDASFSHRVLWFGVTFRSMQLVDMALEFNADVNQRQSDDQYFIHMAAELQDSSILEKLVDAGADMKAKNKADETPFTVAIRFNSVSCVKLLVDRKCEFSGEDALLLAFRCRSHDVLKELLRDETSSSMERATGSLLFTLVASNDLEAFRVVYPITSFSLPVIDLLFHFEKYDMLSAALFEFEHPGLSTQDLTPMIAEAPNDDFKMLLQRKIDVMNGIALEVKVKKEEIEEEELQSTS